MIAEQIKINADSNEIPKLISSRNLQSAKINQVKLRIQ